MCPRNFAQLANDAVLIAEHREAMRHKCIQLIGYSDKKYQSLNTKKTLYCEFASEPDMDKLLLYDDVSIDSVNKKDGYSILVLLSFRRMT